MKNTLNRICKTFSTAAALLLVPLSHAASVKPLPNAAATLEVADNQQSARLGYENNSIFIVAENGQKLGAASRVEKSSNGAITQTITLTQENPAALRLTVLGSSEALAAETRGESQKKFPLVRTSHGLSNNLRNNAVYDRRFDWMLEAPEGTRIVSRRGPHGGTRFQLTLPVAKESTLVFRPRYYQKHKNIPYFEPWIYQVRKDSITGWSSWWAYFRNCTQKDVDDLLDVWQKKHIADFGYRFIQLDDVFQGGEDGDMKHAPREFTQAYLGGRPETWLKWRKDKFPGGLEGYVKSVKAHGFEPGIWMGCFFTDQALAEKHPEYFVRDENGKPTMGRWVTYVLDVTNPKVVDKYIRPTFRGFKKAGITYVKIDQLRHMLYDNLNPHVEYLMKNGKNPQDLLRAYLKIAREELGPETFILACWGVLPEVAGIADACRIAGDGFGPVSMQQYNSWNGIVWRNDPDHCDVSPKKGAVGKGNVTETVDIKAAPRETIIRPALASLSGSLLILSDRPDVYADDNNLHGVKRSSPVPFSVPGQLYDFDPSRTDKVKSLSRLDIKSGANPSPIDAAQHGHVNPYWLNEFNMDYENWNVLHRLNWDKNNTAPEETVKFADLGLDPAKSYLVYEFWSQTFLGLLQGEMKLSALPPMGIASYAIRESMARPQLVSTTRHFSQGAAEISAMRWKNNTLEGISRVVVDDPYTVSVYVPDGYELKGAAVNGKAVKTLRKGQLVEFSYTPAKTGTIRWAFKF